MRRIIKNLLRVARLDDLTCVHYGDTIGNARNDAKVVGDQHETHVEFFLQIGEQQQYLRLNRYIEGGGGFVGNQQIRIAHQGHGDHDTLAEPPGELVRVLGKTARRRCDAHLLEQKHGALTGFARTRLAMALEHFFELVTDGVGWVQ